MQVSAGNHIIDLVMSCLDKVADYSSLKSEVQELKQRFNALEDREEEYEPECNFAVGKFCPDEFEVRI